MLCWLRRHISLRHFITEAKTDFDGHNWGDAYQGGIGGWNFYDNIMLSLADMVSVFVYLYCHALDCILTLYDIDFALSMDYIVLKQVTGKMVFGTFFLHLQYNGGYCMVCQEQR